MLSVLAQAEKRLQMQELMRLCPAALSNLIPRSATSHGSMFANLVLRTNFIKCKLKNKN